MFVCPKYNNTIIIIKGNSIRYSKNIVELTNSMYNISKALSTVKNKYYVDFAN